LSLLELHSDLFSVRTVFSVAKWLAIESFLLPSDRYWHNALLKAGTATMRTIITTVASGSNESIETI
jgi:hypothetical protein